MAKGKDTKKSAKATKDEPVEVDMQEEDDRASKNQKKPVQQKKGKGKTQEDADEIDDKKSKTQQKQSKKGQRGKNADSDDEDNRNANKKGKQPSLDSNNNSDDESAPANTKKSQKQAQKKQKKQAAKGKRGDDSDEEVDDDVPQPSSSKNNQKKQQQQQKKPTGNNKQSKKNESDDEDHLDDAEDDEEEIPQPASNKKNQKKQQKKQQKKSVKEDSEDEDADEDEEEEDVPQPVGNKKNQKKQQQQQKKQQKKPSKPVSDDDEHDDIDDEDEEDIPQPVSSKNKKNQKKQQQQKKPAKKVESEDEEDLEEDEEVDEEETIPQPASNKKNQKKQQQQQKKAQQKKPVKKEESEDEDVDDEEDDEEETIPQPVSNKKNQKKQQQQKKGQQQQKQQQSAKKYLSEEDEEEEADQQEDEEELAEQVEQKLTISDDKPAKKEVVEEKPRETPPAPVAAAPAVAAVPSKEEEKEVEEEPMEEDGDDGADHNTATATATTTTATATTTKKKFEKPKKLSKAEKKRQAEEAKKAMSEQPPVEKAFAVEEDRKGSDSTSKDIHIEKFDISFPGKVLFKDATLALAHGRRYGLVGPNGLGKSSLLKCIATREAEFINIPKHFDIHYVEQEIVGDDTIALQSVISADTERTRLMAEEKRLMESDDPDAGQTLSEIHNRLSQIEAFSAEARASSILSGLQFTEEMKQMPTKSFSGGWRMRISLARALFRRPTLLLLDEPTNHLDLLAVIWLETYLLKWKNTLLIVSHDQDFLNSVTTDVIHLYQQKLHYYRGNYDSFRKNFEDSVALKRKAYEKQQRLIKEMQVQKNKKGDKTKSADKVKEKAGTKVLRNKQLMADKTKKGKGADDDSKKAELLEAVPRDYTVNFEFPEPDTLNIPVIQVNDASFGYEPDRLLFKDLNFGIDMDSRIALVGPNGAGKSTLVKLFTGELTPTAGSIQRNRKLVTGKFSQHFVDVLDMSKSPIDYLASRFAEEEHSQQELRKFIGRFGLTGQTQLQKISSLSGGQKSRVVFAEICMRHPHILFLDEPTNHLDIESIEALSEALNEFTGGVVLVSHDARMISSLNCQIWVVADNTVTIFDGDFEDYRNELIEEFEERLEEEERQRKEKEDSRRQQREEELRQRNLKTNKV